VVSATVRPIADRWFVSVQVELEEAPVPCESQAGIGVDLGVNRLRQLDYKARMRGNHLEIVDRWFASSKGCSKCGLVKDNLSLGERAFVCEGCGFQSDRDLNAAMNLFRTVSSTGTQACGEGGSGSSRRWSETVLCEAGTWA
jgi:transposase